MGTGFSKFGYEQTDANGSRRSPFVQLLDPVGVCIQPVVWEDAVVPEVNENNMEGVMDQPQAPSPHEIPSEPPMPAQTHVVPTEE